MTAPGLDSPLYLVLLPVGGALVVALFGWAYRGLRDWLALITLLGAFLVAWRLRSPAAPVPFALGTLTVGEQQIPLSWRVDQLSGLFLLIFAALAVLTFLVAALVPGRRGHRLFGTVALLLSVAAANATLLATDLITLFLATVPLSLFLLLLLIADGSKESQASGLKLFAAIEVPGLALFLAIALLLGNRSGVTAHALSSLSGFGFVGGALLFALLVRAALGPVQTWLSGALQTATWSSAALVASLAAPLGGYLLLRFGAALPGFGDVSRGAVFLAAGCLSLLAASYSLARQGTLRPMLAALAVAQGGLFALALAAGGSVASHAALAQLVFTAFFFCLLYIAIGALGASESISDIARGAASHPLAALALVVGLLATSGLPPFYGFAIRQAVLEELLATGFGSGGPAYLLGALLVLLATALSMAAVGKLLNLVLGEIKVEGGTRWWQRPVNAPLAVAVGVALVFALDWPWLDANLVRPALAVPPPIAGFTWLGLGSGLLLLLAALSGGLSLLSRVAVRPLPTVPVRLEAAAQLLDRAISHGYLDPYYLAAGLVAFVGLGVAAAVDWVFDRLAV